MGTNRKPTMTEVLRKYMKAGQGETYETALAKGLKTGKFDDSVLTARERQKVEGLRDDSF